MRNVDSPWGPGTEFETYKLKISNCKSGLRIFLNYGEGYKQYDSSLKIDSVKGMHTLYSLKSSAAPNRVWVESRYWAITELGSKAKVQWARMVSNPSYDMSSKLRSYTQSGVGELKQTSSSCG
ncbi:hypothetical protein ACUR5C_00320 [Aliikangiella sp. IMCC44653]